MILDKKHQHRLVSKEKAYYRRLVGDYKDEYNSFRKRNNSISQNKRRLHNSRASGRISFYTIHFPEVVDIYSPNHCRRSIKKCNSIIENGNRILLDFSEVKILSAAVTAYLLSMVLKALSMGHIIECKHPKDAKARSVLQKTGLFRILGKSNPYPESQVNKYPDVKCWYVYIGKEWDAEILYECVHEFTSSHFAELSWDIPGKHKKRIERNVKELIGNIIEHAYPEEYLYDKHWILFATYQTEKELLELVISDSGKSIPVTYVQYHKDDPSLKDIIKKGIRNDTKLIELAVRESSSGTGLAGRGYGLKNIEKMISGYGGSMLIYSKTGCYLSKDNQINLQQVRLKKPINGTIVNISLPLESLK